MGMRYFCNVVYVGSNPILGSLCPHGETGDHISLLKKCSGFESS